MCFERTFSDTLVRFSKKKKKQQGTSILVSSPKTGMDCITITQDMFTGDVSGCGLLVLVLYPGEQRRTKWIFKSENSFEVSFVKETVGNFSRVLYLGSITSLCVGNDPFSRRGCMLGSHKLETEVRARDVFIRDRYVRAM